MMFLPIRIAADTLPALVVGAVLIGVSIAMALKQWWAFRRLALNPKLDESAYQHGERQIHRRLSVSGVMFLIGLLIPVGDQFGLFFLQRPGLFFFFWAGILMLVMVMVVIALIDLLSTVAYAKTARVQLGAERRAIEEGIRAYRASQNRNSPQNPESH